MTQNNENKMANGAPVIDEAGLRFASKAFPEKLAEYQVAYKGRKYNDIRWYVPGTQAIATLALLPSASGNGEFRVSLGICPENSDEEISCYLSKGTREDLIEYLRSPECQGEVYDSVKDLWQNLWEEL